MRIYLSGKISGLPYEEAFSNFEKAERALTTGSNDNLIIPEIVNPMRLCDHSWSWEECMKKDIEALCTCDAIYLLKNFYESRGARIEYDLAKTLKLKIIFEQ